MSRSSILNETKPLLKQEPALGLSAALRDNLRRRKQQSRDRLATGESAVEEGVRACRKASDGDRRKS